jgi:hypothetical protein
VNWRKFYAVIAWGITGAAGLSFIAFLLGLGSGVDVLTLLWGAAVSFVIALIGVAVICGMGYDL